MAWLLKIISVVAWVTVYANNFMSAVISDIHSENAISQHVFFLPSSSICTEFASWSN